MFAQYPSHPRRVSTGTHRADQRVDGAELVDQLLGEPAIGVDVIGILILIGAPRIRFGGK
ncbi:Uncharacterised protein [Mycobacteroides abscessus subsp. abscessus]|nr:Uncharacterised protein [Mycobacteroides abscessus]SHQ20025.1 Uncharacterised protein [Mycobacteroides abscessus subsp. abscessus]SHU25554.1 Uncharacterised protein [Mycobacteroides abscessus subsp. abscessus]SHW59056.1 Uncharacterised protein [Mycobacteroides abscessus subsp. abscessus]SHX45889.1 Uncharacterised protein [Mycobacteroides abscessus subsp. abscessus]